MPAHHQHQTQHQHHPTPQPRGPHPLAGLHHGLLNTLKSWAHHLFPPLKLCRRLHCERCRGAKAGDESNDFKRAVWEDLELRDWNRVTNSEDEQVFSWGKEWVVLRGGRVRERDVWWK